MVPFGTHVFATYTKPHATDTAGSFVIAQDFEDFTGCSKIEIIAGMNIVATDTHFNATFNPVTAYNMLLDFFVHYDILLTFENGMIHVMP